MVDGAISPRDSARDAPRGTRTGPRLPGAAPAAAGLPVEIPGLSTLIPEITPGAVVTVESGLDPAKSFFIRKLALTAVRLGWSVTFVTSRDREELTAQLRAEGAAGSGVEYLESLEIVERDRLDTPEAVPVRPGLLAIDSFSLLTLGIPALGVAKLLREIRVGCRRGGAVAVLALDRGMGDSQAEAITTHLADGVLQFHAREGAEGLLRFLRVPKWMGSKFVDQNVHYDFDGRRIAIDLRRRVL